MALLYPGPTVYPSPTLYPGEQGTTSEPPTPIPVTDAPRIRVVWEEDRLSLSVIRADGSGVNWSEWEPDKERVLADLSYSTTAPGGDKDLSCGLFRDLHPRSDEGIFDTVRVLGAGNDVPWEGRMQQLPRETALTTRLSPSAVGWQAHLADDPTFRERYVDREVGNWGSPPREEEIAIRTAGTFRYGDPSVGDGQISMSHRLEGVVTPISEAWYDAGAGRKVKRITFDFIEYNTQSSDPAWFLSVYTTANRNGFAGPYEAGGDYHEQGLPNGQNITVTFATPQRYAFFQWGYNNTLVASPEVDRTVVISRIAVYGNHAVPIVPTTMEGDPSGVLASDVVADIVSRAAPKLNFTKGAGGTIKPTTFAIPHLVFADQVTAVDAIMQTNAYHDWNWGVRPGKEFYYEPHGSGETWHARTSDGAQLALDGDDATDLYNGVVVGFPDAGSAQYRYAGPPGSGMDVETTLLEDKDAANPVNEHGLRRWMKIDLPFPSTDYAAVQLGNVRLAEANLAKRRGSITLTGRVRHPTRGLVPVSRIRAGDTIVFTDRPGDPPRRIDETSYSHGGRTVQLGINGPLTKSEALFERILLTTGLA